MKKSEFMYELAREHICSTNNANFEIWEIISVLEDIVEEAQDPKHYAKAFKELGQLTERLEQLAQDTDVDDGLSRAARKYELDEYYKELKKAGRL